MAPGVKENIADIFRSAGNAACAAPGRIWDCIKKYPKESFSIAFSSVIVGFAISGMAITSAIEKTILAQEGPILEATCAPQSVRGHKVRWKTFLNAGTTQILSVTTSRGTKDGEDLAIFTLQAKDGPNLAPVAIQYTSAKCFAPLYKTARTPH